MNEAFAKFPSHYRQDYTAFIQMVGDDKTIAKVRVNNPYRDHKTALNAAISQGVVSLAGQYVVAIPSEDNIHAEILTVGERKLYIAE